MLTFLLHERDILTGVGHTIKKTYLERGNRDGRDQDGSSAGESPGCEREEGQEGEKREGDAGYVQGCGDSRGTPAGVRTSKKGRTGRRISNVMRRGIMPRLVFSAARLRSDRTEGRTPA